MWLSRRRSVTPRGSWSEGGKRHTVSGRSRPKRRSSTSRSAPIAATGFETEATWNTVPAFTAARRAASSTPYPHTQATRPNRTTATAAPGTRSRRSASGTTASSTRPSPATLAGSLNDGGRVSRHPTNPPVMSASATAAATTRTRIGAKATTAVTG